MRSQSERTQRGRRDGAATTQGESMKTTSARVTTFVVISLMALGACATATKMSTDDAIAARQKHMKDQGAAMRSISDKLKAGQVQAVAVDAEKLVQTSSDLPRVFPEGSLDPKTSRAKPEIWQKRAEFEGYAKTLQTKATQLAQTARTGNAQATSAAVADIGRTTCTACHDAFRGPEIKK
jgi:cytochrome c556